MTARTLYSRLFLLLSLQLTITVIISKFSRPVEYCHRPVCVKMYPYLDPYVIAPVFIPWYLQGFTFKTDTVVMAYCPFMLFAQGIVQICPEPWDKCCPLL